MQKIYFPSSTSLKVSKLKDKNPQSNQKGFNQELKKEGEKEGQEKDQPVQHKSRDLPEKPNKDEMDFKLTSEDSNEEEKQTPGKLIDIII
jgi:hypothetical protein